MSENCNNEQCSSCGQDCNERKETTSFLAKENEESRIKKIIGIVSGKGGVGKSLVTSMLACEMKKRGNRTAILDADITGPSIPKAFGITERAFAVEAGIIPVKSATGIEIISLNIMIDDETEPVVWRGPIIAGTVKQFYTDVIWGEVDYMFVDMPPGTGDVPLTVFQSLPLAGIIVVTSPQELVSMIVEKAVNMAEKMDIPVLGLVENMSYLQCPDCGKEIAVFGESKAAMLAQKHKIPTYAKIPMDPALAKACDEGGIERIEAIWLKDIVEAIK